MTDHATVLRDLLRREPGVFTGAEEAALRALLDERLNPTAETLDAEAYRYLRDEISSTMADDAWDLDGAESWILAQYVRWLVAGQPRDEDGYPARRESYPAVGSRAEREARDQDASLIGPLTAAEWCSLRLTGGDDDPLRCCAASSELRDALFDVLRMGGGTEYAYRLVEPWQQAVAYGHGEGDPLLDRIRDFYALDAPTGSGTDTHTQKDHQ
jgi:hypothetical protein